MNISIIVVPTVIINGQGKRHAQILHTLINFRPLRLTIIITLHLNNGHIRNHPIKHFPIILHIISLSEQSRVLPSDHSDIAGVRFVTFLDKVVYAFLQCLFAIFY